MKTEYKIELTKNMIETQVANHYVKHPIKLTDGEWRDIKCDMDEAIKACIFKMLSEKKVEFKDNAIYEVEGSLAYHFNN